MMFYKPVQANRMFTKTSRYSNIDWSDFDAVVTAFQERIDNWYIKPVSELAQLPGGHYAFSVMAIDCLLIDTFSQFASGQLHSSGRTFKGFIVDHLPNYDATLNTSIYHHEHGKKRKLLQTVADVLYHGFRCGILHQAHIPLYGSIDPVGPAFQETASGHATYCSDGTDCPNVTVNPLLLLDDLKSYFADYLARLKDSGTQNDVLRSRFKVKFADSFGVNV